jgi:hypothetical protein
MARSIRVWYSDGREEDNAVKPFLGRGRDFGEEQDVPNATYPSEFAVNNA